MYIPRIIPVLLLKGSGLVKTIKFNAEKYVGDPINAVRIFNELEADELVILDIEATKEKRKIDLRLVEEIGDEAYMPFAVGGGIKNIKDVKDILSAGAEKVVINTAAVDKPHFVKEIADTFGSQSVIVSIDIKRKLFGSYKIYSEGGKKKCDTDLYEYVENMQKMGAGELLINSIDLDGAMTGFDIELMRSISSKVDIPIIACGGAGNLTDLVSVYHRANVNAVAAGSLFVFHGQRRAVLINYPDKITVINAFQREGIF